MKINLSILCLIVTSLLILSFSSNPPNGRTGAPGQGDCTGCHTPPGSTSLNGSMDISGLPNTVMAGNTYTVTVSVLNPATNANRAGFQIVALDETNGNTGTLSNPSASSTITSSGGKVYHEHAPAVPFSGSNNVSWTVDWTAPSAGTYADGDSLFLYGASIIANGSGSSGDLTRLTNLRVDIMNPVAPPVSISVSNLVNPNCSDSADGQATAVITGGTEPFTIDWDNGEVGMNATMLASGPHGVTVTDALNETANTSFSLMAPTALQIINESIQDVSCFGLCDGSISYDVVGGVPPYSFQWTGPNGYSSNISQPADLCVGLYNLDITDSNNCSLNASYEIQEPLAIFISNPIIIHVSCNGLSDGNISINPVGGTGTLTTNWSNGTSGNTLANVPAGSYTATILDDNGCTYEETFTITEPLAIDISITELVSIPCYGLFGTLEASSSISGLQYEWSNGVDTPINEGIPAGNYSVTLSDANGCTAEASYELIEPDSLILAFDITQIQMGMDGEISVIPSGGNSPFSYIWNTGSMDSTITNLNAGTYTVTVTDNNNCSAIGSVELDDNCSLVIAIANTSDVTCPGGSDGSASIDYNGDIAMGLEILWSTGDTILGIDNLEAGSYSVTISDGGTCSVDTTLIIGEPDSIDISFIVVDYPTNESSMDGTISAEVTGGTGPNYQYLWNGTVDNDTLFNVGVQFHILEITDENGCFHVDTFHLEIPDCDYSLDLDYSDFVCSDQSNGTASVTITGGTEVITIWSTNDTTDMITGLTSGNYYVSASDSIGCVDTIFFTIDQSLDTLLISEILYDTITCDDSLGSIEIILDEEFAPYTYTWSTGDSTNLADSLEFGQYSVTITNKDGCGDILIIETVADFGDELSYDVDEISIYLDENGEAPAYDNGINNLVGGCADSLYVIYPGNEYECSDIGVHYDTVSIYNFTEVVQEEIIQVTVYDTIPPTIMCPDTVFNYLSDCEDGGTIFGTMTFPGDSIHDNCTQFEDQLIEFMISYSESGFYDVSFEIVDECGNSTSCTLVYEILVYPAPSIEIETIDVSCFAGEDGCIEIDVTGGTPPYQIEPAQICDISAGTYNVGVFDSNGCGDIFEVVITEPTEITITQVDKGSETEGESDGFIDVFVEGGNEPYSYEWTENGEVVSNLEDLVNFPASQYELVVTDANGCTQTFSSFIDIANHTKNEAFAQIKIYPNPFNERLIIEGTPNHEVEISLTNILGQRISLPLMRSDSQSSLSTTELASGVYFVNVRIDNEIQSYKLIKSN